MMAFAGRDLHVRGEDLAALHFFGGDAPAFEAQFAQLGFDGARSAPASTRAPSTMSPLMPEKQSK